MAKAETKVPVTTESKPESPVTATQTQMQMWRPFENLRREVDRLFEGLTLSPFRRPFRRPAFGIEPFWAPESWVAVPAVDFVEKDNAYEVHADLPGMDEKDIEVKVANGVLTIKGQKEEAKEEKKEDYHLRERHYGSYERALRVSRHRRHGQDRGDLQEGRPHRHLAEDRRGPEAGQEDRGQGRVTAEAASHRRRHVSALATACEYSDLTT